MSLSSKDRQGSSSADESSPRLPPSTPVLGPAADSKRQRSDESHGRTLSILEGHDLDDIWSEAASHASADARSSRLNKARTESSHGATEKSKEFSKENLERTEHHRFSLSSSLPLFAEKPPTIVLDPEKCLKVNLVLRSSSSRLEGKKSKRLKDETKSLDVKESGPPLVTLDKSSKLLGRRRRLELV